MKTPLRLAWALLLVSAACAQHSLPARVLVRGATLQLVVANLEGLEASLAERIARLDGFTTRSERTESGLTVSFRVPAAKLELALASVESLASSVESREVHGEDVTEEYVDLEAQLANLTASRTRLLVLLDQAQKVEDALEVNKGLTDVQGQLERIAGKKKLLEQSSALSLVTATFSPERRAADWRPMVVARGAVLALIRCLELLASAAIVAVIFSPLWAPAVWLFRRRRGRV